MLSSAVDECPSFHAWSKGNHVKGPDGGPLIVFHGGARFDVFRTAPARFRVRQHYGRATWGVQECLGEDCWTWTGGMHESQGAAEAAVAKMVTVRPAYATDDIHVAYGYASQGAVEDSEIKPLYLRMERPLDLRAPGTFRKWVGDIDGSFHDVARNMAHSNYQLRSGGKVPQQAFDAGFDGIIFHDTDVMDRGLHTSYAFFRSDQVLAAPSEHGASYYDYPIRQDGNEVLSASLG